MHAHMQVCKYLLGLVVICQKICKNQHFPLLPFFILLFFSLPNSSVLNEILGRAEQGRCLLQGGMGEQQQSGAGCQNSGRVRRVIFRRLAREWCWSPKESGEHLCRRGKVFPAWGARLCILGRESPHGNSLVQGGYQKHPGLRCQCLQGEEDIYVVGQPGSGSLSRMILAGRWGTCRGVSWSRQSEESVHQRVDLVWVLEPEEGKEAVHMGEQPRVGLQAQEG